MNWDTIIAFVIIGALILAIWAKVSQQTIVELLTDIKDMLSQQREDAVETVGDVIVYK